MLEKLKKTDWFMISILVVFMVLGTFVVHSATSRDSLYSHTDMKNLINYGIGFFVCISAMLMDYRLLVKGALYFYIFGVGLLVAVYLFGADIHGSRSWFELPAGFNFQPAELMKLIVIVAVAAYIGRRNGEQLKLWTDVIPIGFIVFIPFALIIIQPDLGNAIIFIVVLLVMYWIGNIKYLHVLIGLVLIVGFIVLFFYFFQLYYDQLVEYLRANDMNKWVHRLNRIQTFIDPSSATADARYQVDNSMRAIGSGSLFGEGFMKGDSVQKGFIPYPYSDSIFVVIGEEFGFVGSSFLLLLYFLLIYRMIYIAIQCTDRVGSFIIVGIVSMYVFQVFENIGMLIGIMPLTGITLPFVSYGGSSLLINMLSIGLVMSIHVHQEKPNLYG
ncbi:FtsW/RodA/SpoVE family cell cycle protein [Paenibacillus koleovorans]|uniref:FtsW/RodA/SpoVE family cell cycle protein n=1 Tax=Paenibacillus koleovorans TaxID=121608 RepID=UPI000FD8DD24|nr:FtsW/RodA/SpoVE family cell cycle protein [Paenibacillus koleovorans]